MTDFLSPAKRSELMARIRSKNTQPEMKIRRILHRLGLRYRLHRTDLPGKPDLVFPQFKAVLFVHGCFWHRHQCKSATTPQSNMEFWTNKFEKNVMRDSQTHEALRMLGWRVFVVWQCELSTMAKAAAAGERLTVAIRKNHLVGSPPLDEQISISRQTTYRMITPTWNVSPKR